MEKKFKVAVVQSAPVLFDKVATIKKTGILVSEAVNNGVKLVLFLKPLSRHILVDCLLER